MILMILTMSFSGILFSEKLNKIEDQLMEEETKFLQLVPDIVYLENMWEQNGVVHV